jgi:site-specific recombinase XerC
LRPALGTLAADADRYLARAEVQSLASHKSRGADTRAWLPLLGHLRRDQIATAEIQKQVDDWRKAGIAAWTVRHRLNALRQVYSLLDGPTAYNPVRSVVAPPKPRNIPRAIDYATIRTTLNQMEPSATKAFLMIMAFCGFRPEEIRRTEPWMVRLDSDPPQVTRNTAKGGDVTVVPLSDEGVLAWQMFIRHEGFDRQPDLTDRGGNPCRTRTFPNANRDWKAAMVRAGLAPTRSYDLVHSYCTQLLMAGGGDITLVQKARGHRDIRTTMIYTQVVSDPRLEAAVQKAFRVAGSRGSSRN